MIQLTLQLIRKVSSKFLELVVAIVEADSPRTHYRTYECDRGFFAAVDQESATELYKFIYGKSPLFMNSVHPWTTMYGVGELGVSQMYTLSEVTDRALRNIPPKEWPSAMKLEAPEWDPTLV